LSLAYGGVNLQKNMSVMRISLFTKFVKLTSLLQRSFVRRVLITVLKTSRNALRKKSFDFNDIKIFLKERKFYFLFHFVFKYLFINNINSSLNLKFKFKI